MGKDAYSGMIKGGVRVIIPGISGGLLLFPLNIQ